MMTREEIIAYVTRGYRYGQPTYLMTPDPTTLTLCAELVKEGVLVRVDTLNPSFPNSQYTFVLNSEEGRKVAFLTEQEHGR